MAHTEKFLLCARDARTASVIKEKWVFDRYVGECFASDWHMNPKTRQANIYLGKTLIYGFENEEFKTALDSFAKQNTIFV